MISFLFLFRSVVLNLSVIYSGRGCCDPCNDQEGLGDFPPYQKLCAKVQVLVRLAIVFDTIVIKEKSLVYCSQCIFRENGVAVRERRVCAAG